MTDPLTKKANRTVLLILLIAFIANGSLVAQEKSLVVFAVRHAEKVSKSSDSQMMDNDPDLTQKGIKRSVALSLMLADVALDGVHSSDYLRTRNTAAPTALAQNLDIEIYNPRDLESLTIYLKQEGGNHLVVGHSNTTHNLVELLGGDPHEEIQENEYDRLYVITLHGEEVISSLLLRFGD